MFLCRVNQKGLLTRFRLWLKRSLDHKKKAVIHLCREHYLPLAILALDFFPHRTK